MKAPKLLVYFLLFWLALFIFNNVTVFMDLDQTIQAFMEQVQANDIEFSEDFARKIFMTTTGLISFFSLTFAFLLYKGVKAIRIMHLVFSFIGLPFSLFGLLQFASMENMERFQSMMGIVLSISGIYVLLRKDVKAYFEYDSSVDQSEVEEDNIDNIEEKLS
jgi:succinate-acetate transporter protein